MSESTIRYDVDADGIVTLTLDDPASSANTMNAAYVRSMTAVVDRLYEEREVITGVVITSGKKTFFAGGDLVTLQRATPADADRSGARAAATSPAARPSPLRAAAERGACASRRAGGRCVSAATCPPFAP